MLCPRNSDALRRVLVPSLDAPLLLTSSQLRSSPSCSSIGTLPPEALPRQVLQCRLQESHTKSWISLLQSQINELNLPNITTLIQNTPSKSCWKRCIREILGTHTHLQLLNQAEVKSNLEYLTMCDPNFSTPSPLWSMTHCADQLHLTTKSNFRIRLLLGCHGLESDACRFSSRSNGQACGDPSCKLCGAQLEDAPHFISTCPSLETRATQTHPTTTAGPGAACRTGSCPTQHVTQMYLHTSCSELTGLKTSNSKCSVVM